MFDLQCLSASRILSSHGMSQDGGVALGDFSILCPALLHQIDGGACIVDEDAAVHWEEGRWPSLCRSHDSSQTLESSNLSFILQTINTVTTATTATRTTPTASTRQAVKASP